MQVDQDYANLRSQQHFTFFDESTNIDTIFYYTTYVPALDDDDSLVELYSTLAGALSENDIDKLQSIVLSIIDSEKIINYKNAVITNDTKMTDSVAFITFEVSYTGDSLEGENYDSAIVEENIVYNDIEIIQKVQNILNEKGYECGTADGIIGQNTRKAISNYQKDNGLFESGNIDDLLLEKLGIENASQMQGNNLETKDIIVDENEWENWTSTGNCNLFSFMNSSEMLDFSWGNPERNGDQVNVNCFNANGDKITDFSMYYGVSNQKIIYAGLVTDNIDTFSSDAFRNACVKLMRAYNICTENGDVIFNITQERAEEIVDYAMNSAQHCLVDEMRIRVVQKEGYYSFHIEY